MLKRTLIIGIGAALLAGVVATPILLAPGPIAASPPAAPIASSEHTAAIEAMRPTTTGRPVIALITRNDGTEVADFLTIYGVLKRADVADVVIVAERADPVRLYPAKLGVEPNMAAADFDARYPEGPDYVVVPAMDPGTDPFIASWIATQYQNGAKIVSVCNGSRMLSTAGLLDGRRATGHWSAIAELQAKHPTMQWVPNRRYVSDDGVTSSTGITASIPTMLALVEAIAGRERAAEVADELGVADWDARHRSASFELNNEHRKTFIRNTLSFWRRETIGIPVVGNVDEVALGLTLDAYSRTQLTNVVTVGNQSVESRYGLVLHPEQEATTARVDETLPTPPTEMPAAVLEQELPRIAARYDRATAGIVALVMEYPWTGEGAFATR